MEKSEKSEELINVGVSLSVFKLLITLMGIDKERAKVYDSMKMVDANDLIAADNAKAIKAG